MYLTLNRFNRILNIPISLAQTELRRSKSLQVTQWVLEVGQRLNLKLLTIQVVKILTPGPLPGYTNTALGTASIGLYLGTSITSPLAWASTNTVGSSICNPFSSHIVATPGLYTVIVSNNTNNLDLSVAATGSMRIYF